MKIRIKVLLLSSLVLISCINPQKKVIPDDMVFVEGDKYTVGDNVLHKRYEVDIPDLAFSRYEITNAEVAEIYNWAYGKKLWIFSTKSRDVYNTDVIGRLPDTMPRVILGENFNWDLIDINKTA